MEWETKLMFQLVMYFLISASESHCTSWHRQQILWSQHYFLELLDRDPEPALRCGTCGILAWTVNNVKLACMWVWEGYHLLNRNTCDVAATRNSWPVWEFCAMGKMYFSFQCNIKNFAFCIKCVQFSFHYFSTVQKTSSRIFLCVKDVSEK